MNKLAVIILVIFGIIVVLSAGAAYVITSPMDLGVRYTTADLQSVNNKLGIKYEGLPSSDDPKASLKLSGQKPLDAQISQSELTALLNQPSKQWKNYPVSDVQFRINDDGSVEATGRIDVKKAKEYIKATNVPDKYTSLVADKMDMVPVNPSFDYKGDYKIVDGKLQGEMTELKIGPVPVPKDWADNNKGFIGEFVEDRIASAGMTVESATFEGGKLNIKGSVPETIAFEK